MSAITTSNEREIQPYQLSIEQLSNIKNQHEEELQELQRQLESLQGAEKRFFIARKSLDDIAESPEGQSVLVPLNTSLYVPAKISNATKVLVELGTGYFCEKNIAEARDLIDRKMMLVSKSMESIEKVGGQKKKTLDQIVQVMNFKIQQGNK